jgi:hypothetical protein
LPSLGDALGSVRRLAGAGGAITLDMNYDPFGNEGARRAGGVEIFVPQKRIPLSSFCLLLDHFFLPPDPELPDPPMYQFSISNPQS